jgi:hypothetical protein
MTDVVQEEIVDEKLRKEMRFLKAYALISMLVFAVLIFVAAKGPDQKTKFDQIDVHRINVVEPDGTLRMTISNNAASPGPVLGGLYMKKREGTRGAGMIFFNDQGDECGGMTWAGKKKDGKVNADGGLMFDQFDQDQTVGMNYSQDGDQRTSGFHVWNRSLTPIGDFARQVNAVEEMKDGPEKDAAMKKLREQAIASGMGGQERIFVGRMRNNDAVVALKDTNGKPRIVMSVDAQNMPKIQVLDENGKVTYKVPLQEPANHP